MKKSLKIILAAMLCAGVMSMSMNVDASVQKGKNMQSVEKQADRIIKTEKLNLTEKWDKVFEKSDKVDHRKITFVNRYGITLAADMYVPINVTGKLPALAVSGQPI